MKKAIMLYLLGAGFAGVAAGPVAAEAVLDGSTGSTGSFSGDFEIPAAVGRQEGSNLFHSFDVFHVRADESATFTGPSGIDNVISRVTGGELSRINGLFASEVAGADFFFLNPAGVIFGPQASLDIDGSFHASTADELRFADGAAFSATEPAASSFTMAAPEAFGFLGADAGPIEVRGSDLIGAAGETFSLIGGDVSLMETGLGAVVRTDGRGDVHLVAVRDENEVAVASGSPSQAPSGSILIEGFESGIDVSSELDGGGRVRIHAGELVVDGGFIASDNGFNPDFFEVGRSNGSGPKSSGITIVADNISVRNGALIQSNTFGSGPAGDIVLRVRDLEVSDPDGPIFDGAGIRSDTQGAGRAGDVSVIGAERVVVSGNPRVVGRLVNDDLFRTEISSDVADARSATGRSGNISVNSHLVIVRNSGAISSASQGPGNAGRIEMTGRRIVLETGGQITSSTILTDQSTGRGGSVRVIADQSIEVSGGGQLSEDTMRPEPSGIFASAESDRPMAGPPGNVFVSAPVIRLLDQGEISSESNNLSSGGTVTVRFDKSLEIEGGEITTKASRADAGDITVLGPDGMIIMTADGEISTSVGPDALIEDNPTVQPGESAGDAGDILVLSDFLVLDGSAIQANGIQGRGGNIEVTATSSLIQSQDSTIEALSDLGINGTVEIAAPSEDILQSLEALPSAFLDISSLLADTCAARAARGLGDKSSLVVEGRRTGIRTSPEASLRGGYSTLSPAAAVFMSGSRKVVFGCPG